MKYNNTYQIPIHIFSTITIRTIPSTLTMTNTTFTIINPTIHNTTALRTPPPIRTTYNYSNAYEMFQHKLQRIRPLPS